MKALSEVVDDALEWFIVEHGVGDGGVGTCEFVTLLENSIQIGHFKIGEIESTPVLPLGRRSLSRRMKIGGYPTPQRVVSWGVTLRAMHLFLHGRTLAEIARESRIREPYTLSHSVKRLTGTYPSQHREANRSLRDICSDLARRWSQENGNLTTRSQPATFHSQSWTEGMDEEQG